MRNEQEDIDKLRGLLLGEQEKTLIELKQRLSNRYQRTQDVSEILADSIRLTRGEGNQDLTDALSEPVREAVQHTIESDPQKFADALYPSILPAIRRAIQEMSRQFVEQVDRALTEKISFRHMKWRVESWRTGVPLSSIILRESIDYEVQQLLLIQNGSGLLQGHAYREGAEKTDSAAVSGMLWAIESFVRDSFTNDDEGLNRVTMGEHTLYLVHGPAATLASVVSGVAPPGYLKQAKLTLEELHLKYLPNLEQSPLDESQRDDYEILLKDLLRQVKAPKKESKSRFRAAMTFFGLLLVSGLVIASLQFLDSSRLKGFVTKLNEQPGISVIAAERTGGKWLISALADPAAEKMLPLLERNSIDPGKVEFVLTPFLSLDPGLAVKRIIGNWEIPAAVKVSISDGILRLSGEAPVDWYINLRKTPMLPYGIEAVDTSEITLQVGDLVEYLEGKIGFPGSVEIEPLNGSVRVSGSATKNWVDALGSEIQLIGDKIGFDLEYLSSQK